MNIRKIIREELELVFEFWVSTSYHDNYPDFMDPQFNPQIMSYPPVGHHSFGSVQEDELVGEAMTQIGDVPGLALFVANIGSSINMVFMDLGASKIRGVIKLDEVDGGYEVVSVAADKGFGPMVYESAMMFVSPIGIMPYRSGDITDSAMNVWRKFYDRPDIKKEKLEWSNPFIDDLDEVDDFTLRVFNTKYFKSPTSEFKELLKRGELAIAQNKFKLSDVIERGGNYFAASL